MVICCSAIGCKNRQNSLASNGNKLSFHRFPRDKDLCEAWLVASQRLDFVPTKYSFLCSEHFTEDQFNRSQKGLRLRPNAVPTVFQVIPKRNPRASKQASSNKVAEIQPTIKILPKKLFPVQPRVKIAPKPTFEAQPTVPIAPNPTLEAQANITPNQVFDYQNPITIVPQPIVGDVVSLTPNPLITNLSSIADTIVSSNLIQAALSAYKQSTNSDMDLQQPDGTPVSIYVVHPQANGSNIVTINPNVRNFQPAATVPSPNAGSLPRPRPKSAQTTAQAKAALGEALSNIEKIKQYKARMKKYQKEIKSLHQQHQRQHNKIEKLQGIIQELRFTGFLENEPEDADDTSEEDMSEDEIYAELKKHQPISEEEDDDDDEDDYDYAALPDAININAAVPDANNINAESS